MSHSKHRNWNMWANVFILNRQLLTGLWVGGWVYGPLIKIKVPSYFYNCASSLLFTLLPAYFVFTNWNIVCGVKLWLSSQQLQNNVTCQVLYVFNINNVGKLPSLNVSSANVMLSLMFFPVHQDIVMTLKEKLSLSRIEHFSLVLEQQHSISKLLLLHEEERIHQVRTVQHQTAAQLCWETVLRL